MKISEERHQAIYRGRHIDVVLSADEEDSPDWEKKSFLHFFFVVQNKGYIFAFALGKVPATFKIKAVQSSLDRLRQRIKVRW